MKKNHFALKVAHLSAGYHDKTILSSVSFEVPEGSRCGILGPNGAGKTTLINAIMNINPSVGNITFWDKRYKEVKERIAYIPQKKQVDWSFPITVSEVVLMGAHNLSKHIFKKVSDESYQKAADAIEKMDLTKYKNTHISELSGGQQQRVFIARALAQDADLYIMDEPLTGLDKTSEEVIAHLFIDLQKENKTIVAVHHDWQTVEEYFDFNIFINKYIIDYGPFDPIKFPLSLERTFYKG
jgi:ABC-type Mn2+/Zn2+ transport system ATPase subunit